jgi:hypothetical protein
MKRIGGIIQVKVNGEIFSAKGQFTYNLGLPKRETIVGSDAVHGYKEVPQVPFIEGEFTDQGDLNMAALASVKGATVTLDLANGKMIALRDAIYAGEGTGNSDEGNVDVRFEGEDAEEIV